MLEVAGNAGRIQTSASILFMKKPLGISKDGRVSAGKSASESSASASKAGAANGSAAAAGHVICCRLPAEELTAFDGLCEQLGAKSRSDGLRLVVRMAAGFLEFSRADVGRLDEMRHDLHRIGTGVNQIALAANRGRSDLARDQWEVVDELRQSLPRLRTLLGQIVAERRRQGVALFREFVAGEERRHG